MPFIEIDQLDFAYGRPPRQLALKHIDLSVDRGSTIGLIGPNGGGKTTLLRLLLGLLHPTRGQIRIAGLSPTHAVRRGDLVGYLPQNPTVPESFPLSARQVAQLGLAGKTGMLHSPAKDDLDFVEYLLASTGIADFADEPIGQLSGGQLQRILIARALAPRPQLLLLDEPTTGIDRSGQQRFIDFIQALKKQLNLTVIVVSHDLRTVTTISDRIACLNVTLHYHDVPQRLPGDLIHELFACDLAALGLDGERDDVKHEA